MEKGRVVDLIDWHLHQGVDLSFVLESCISLVTTELTVEVVVVVLFKEGEDVVKVEVLMLVCGFDAVLVVVIDGVIEIVVPDDVVKRVQIKRLLFTDACFWIRQVFIQISN